MQWIYVIYGTKKYVIFALKCMSSGQKNTTGIIVLFNFVPFNFVLFSSMSWHCFELKRTDMHVSEFSECNMFGWSHAPVTFVGVLWSLFHLLTGMSVRMVHATASFASSAAVEIWLQRHCEMMQDGVAELLSFLLPSFVKLVFCWCVQPSVCRSLRQWFFAMSNSWVVFSVWKSENKCFAVDCATLQRQA